MIFSDIINNSGLETSSHCERVAEYTKIFLEKDNHNFTDTEVKSIILGAYLHDIGKSKIDKNILYKKEGLTDEEFHIIQSHSAFGYEIIHKNKKEFSSNEEIVICSNIALLHHKRIDGSGYPKVATIDIPEYVQIVTIIDIFDALTSERCYQNKINRECAIEKMKNGKCGFLDEKMVLKLEKYIDKVL